MGKTTRNGTSPALAIDVRYSCGTGIVPIFLDTNFSNEVALEVSFDAFKRKFKKIADRIGGSDIFSRAFEETAQDKDLRTRES